MIPFKFGSVYLYFSRTHFFGLLLLTLFDRNCQNEMWQSSVVRREVGRAFFNIQTSGVNAPPALRKCPASHQKFGKLVGQGCPPPQDVASPLLANQRPTWMF